MNNVRFSVRTGSTASALTAAILAVSLSACGGGGGGGSAAGGSISSNTPAGEIPTDGASTVATANFSGSSDVTSLSPVLIKSLLGSTNPSNSPISVIYNADPGTKQAASAAGATSSSVSLSDIAQSVIEQIHSSSTTELAHAEAVSSETLSCVAGGKLTISANDADNNKTVNAGDSATVTFENCKAANQVTLNGSFQMFFNAVELNGSTLRGFDVTVTFNNFGVTGLPTYNGSARLWRKVQANGTRNFTRYQNTASLVSGTNVVLSGDVDSTNTSGTTSVSVVGRISLNGAVYGLQSQSNLSYVGSGQFPTSGTLRTSDAKGNAIVITAKSSGVGRAYVPAGQAAASVTLPDAPWSSIN